MLVLKTHRLLAVNWEMNHPVYYLLLYLKLGRMNFRYRRPLMFDMVMRKPPLLMSKGL